MLYTVYNVLSTMYVLYNMQYVVYNVLSTMYVLYKMLYAVRRQHTHAKLN